MLRRPGPSCVAASTLVSLINFNWTEVVYFIFIFILFSVKDVEPVGARALHPQNTTAWPGRTPGEASWVESYR